MCVLPIRRPVEPGESEVCNLDPPDMAHQHVVRLEILKNREGNATDSVKNPVLMEELDSEKSLQENILDVTGHQNDGRVFDQVLKKSSSE